MLKLLFMKELECIVKSYEAYRQALLTELDTRKQQQQWYAQQPAKNFPPNMWLVWDAPKLQPYQCLSCWCRLSFTQTDPNISPKRDTTQSLLGILHLLLYILISQYMAVCFLSLCLVLTVLWMCFFVHVRTVRTHSFCIVFLDNHSYQLLMFCLIILIFNSFTFRVNLIKNSSRLHFTKKKKKKNYSLHKDNEA